MAPRRSAAMAASEAITTSLSTAVASTSSPAPPATSSPAPTPAAATTAKGRKAQQQQQAYTDLVDPPLSPIVAKLRQMWRFAAVCQFMFTFDEAFGVSGFETEALEKDLDGSETNVIPDLVRRLLYTLTLDRNIDTSNWEHHLRVQCLKRVPDKNLFGTHEDPVPFAALSLTDKVKVLHDLCEWQLVDAERFRKLVKNDDEPEVWRIDPIGWDGAENTYWLYDDNRLWIQYAPPAPPPPPPKPRAPPKKGSKRARAEARAKTNAKSKVGASSSGSRRAVQSSSSKNVRMTEPRGVKRTRGSDAASSSSTPAKRTRSSFAPPAAPSARSARRRLRGRGSAVDEDGWEEIPPELLTPSRNDKEEDEEDSDLSEPPDVAGDEESEDDYAPEDEEEEGDEPEQEEPEEQEQDEAEAEEQQDEEQEPELEAEAEVKDAEEQDDEDAVMEDGTGAAATETPAEATSRSAEAAATPADASGEATTEEQAEPEQASDAMAVDEQPAVEGETTAAPEASNVDAKPEAEEEDAEVKPKEEEEDDWVEFEAIAVTRLQWIEMGKRFAKSKHPDEKALHQFISSTILPRVLLDFDELDKQRKIEAALAMRKRSSRIALKESEREERERDRVARLAMEERMSKLRVEEETKAEREREAAELLKSREERMREREERVQAREQEAIDKAIAEQEAKERREKNRQERALKREIIITNGGVPPREDPRDALTDGATPEDDENWELACEVCGKAGINLPDTQQIVCCEQCGVWQHTKCWDTFDRSVHAPKRDWDKIDFYCGRCRPAPEGQPWPGRAPVPGQVKPKSKAKAKTDDKPKDKAQDKAAPRSRPRAKKPKASDASTSSAADTEAAELLAGLAQVASMQQQQPVRPQPYVSIAQSPSRASASSSMHYPTSNGAPSFAPQVQSQPTQSYPRAAPSSPLPPQQQGSSSSSVHAPQQQQQQQAPQLNVAQAQPAQPPAPFYAVNGSPSQHSNGSVSHPEQIAPVPQRTVPAPQQQQAAVPQQASSPASMQPRPPPAVPGTMLPPTPSTPGPSNGERRVSTATPPAAATSPAASALAPVKPPTPGATLSPKAIGVPRSVASQPSGSFPLRHTVMRSPLSGAHGGSPVPGMNLGPALTPRASSPSPRSAQQQRTHNDALYQRQPAIPPPSPSLQLGPGPSSGSLKDRRPSVSSGTGTSAPLVRVPSASSMHEFGPSPPRTAFGSGPSSMAPVLGAQSTMVAQAPGLTAAPTSNGLAGSAALASAPVMQAPLTVVSAPASVVPALAPSSASAPLNGAPQAAPAAPSAPAPALPPIIAPPAPQPQAQAQQQQPTTQPTPSSVAQPSNNNNAATSNNDKDGDATMAPPPPATL